MNVKQLPIYIIILMGLVSCAGGSSSLRGRCEEGICVKIEAVEPIRFGEPVSIIITVSTNKNIPDLGVSLFHRPTVVIENTLDSEKGIETWKGETGIDWIVNAEANQPIKFQRTLHLPLQEGFYDLEASASMKQGFRVSDFLAIYLSKEGSRVYYSGTQIPKTPGPELLPTMGTEELRNFHATLTAMPTITPLPPTWTPSPTASPPAAYPPPAKSFPSSTGRFGPYP